MPIRPLKPPPHSTPDHVPDPTCWTMPVVPPPPTARATRREPFPWPAKIVGDYVDRMQWHYEPTPLLLPAPPPPDPFR